MASPSLLHPKLQMRETVLISPPSGAVATPAALPLSFFDVFWLHASPVERLFFYRLADNAAIPDLLSSLKSSLSHTLISFYPFAGHLRMNPDTTNRYELFYTDGDGVSFIVAELEADFNELVDTSKPRRLSSLLPLVPQLPRHDALMAIQVTVLPCQGIVVGVAVNHACCDGSSSTHFLATWAANCRFRNSVLSPSLPVLDRTTLLADPRGLYEFFTNRLPKPEDFKVAKPETDDGEVVLNTFTLTQKQLQQVKKLVTTTAEQRSTSFRCSTVVAAYGLVWASFVRAKGGPPFSEHAMLFPVNHRARLQPPLPDKYFGNCVGPCTVEAEVGELIGENGLFVACEAIGKAIDRTLKAGLEGSQNWMDDVKKVVRKKLLSVAGAAQFRVYSIDFGFGRPVQVDIVSVAKTGAMAVAESKEDERGIEVGLALTESEMERFKECFAQALELLSRQA